MKFNHRAVLRALLFSVVAASSGCANAQMPAQPAMAADAKAPFSLLPADTVEAFNISGPRADDAKVSVVAVNNPNFKRAIRAQTTKQPQRPYEIQLAAKNVVPIAKNDILLATFWMRTIESPMQEGFVGFTFEQAAADFKRSFGYETSAGSSWKRFDLPFRSADDYAPGEAVMNLRIGFLPQTVEFGGISLVNYGADADIKTLPATRLTYPGGEPDAAWRKAAQERIEKIRKGDLNIIVRDAKGKPIEGAEVIVKQTRQKFGFGSAVSAKALVSDDPADVKYQQMVKTLFNRIVFENDLKWDRWKADRETPQKALKWLRDNDIEARGHVLVWPSWRHSPAQLKALENDPAALRAALNAHITDEAGMLSGQLRDWDVLNEPYKNHDIMDVLGPKVQAEWFVKAREADPEATLYLNDYGIVAAGGKDLAHQQHFEDTIALLVKEGAPIGGIGMQAHFGSDLTPPTTMLAILDRYAKFGLPIQMTEFDVQVPDEQLQADFTRDFLTVMFSHPAVNGVVMWGFWEGRHYAPSAALWNKDWTPKPNGKAWMKLVQDEWHTNVLAKTGADGALKTRAFTGDYQITINAGAKKLERTVNLENAGETKTVTFDMR